jgi:hypothetical protein
MLGHDAQTHLRSGEVEIVEAREVGARRGQRPRRDEEPPFELELRVLVRVVRHDAGNASS